MLGKFFDKVKDGLARTRAAMTETIAAVVPLGTRLDDDAIDDIEAALIGADMGLETATEIVDELRDRLRDEQIADGPAGVMRILEEQVAGIVALDEGGALPLEGPLPGTPFVILIVGVNGAGKTNLLEAVSFLAPGRGLRRARRGAGRVHAARLELATSTRLHQEMHSSHRAAGTARWARGRRPCHLRESRRCRLAYVRRP